MVMVPERTVMAAYRRMDLVRLERLEQRQFSSPREGKDTAAECLNEPDQQGTRWKRPQSRYDFYFLWSEVCHPLHPYRRCSMLTQMDEVGTDIQPHLKGAPKSSKACPRRKQRALFFFFLCKLGQ